MPTREETTAKGYADLGRLGVEGYMQSRPSTFPYATGYKWYNDPQYGVAEAAGPAKASLIAGQGFSQAIGWPISDAIAELRAQIEDKKAMRQQFRGAEGTYIRWMLDYQIELLEWEIDRKINKAQTSSQLGAVALGKAETEAFQAREGARLEATGPGFVPGAEAAGTGAERVAGAMGREFGVGGRPQLGEPPIPGWMQPYLTKPSAGIEPLRPLGAQAELTTNQLGQMAGYLAFAKGNMFDLERHWTPYTRLSESLFPKQTKLGKRWRVASQ